MLLLLMLMLRALRAAQPCHGEARGLTPRPPAAPAPRRKETLFAWRGRALPMGQWLVYMAYVLLVVLLVNYRVANYANSAELRGLQFPLSTMGGPPSALAAARRAPGGDQ
jgi:hypothetical protein